MAAKKVSKALSKAGERRERRKGGDRRVAQDRRELPPRPEGRRKNGGRRTTDPKDV